MDAGVIDAGLDAGTDAGFDAGVLDAGAAWVELGAGRNDQGAVGNGVDSRVPARVLR